MQRFMQANAKEIVISPQFKPQSRLNGNSCSGIFSVKLTNYCFLNYSIH